MIDRNYMIDTFSFYDFGFIHDEGKVIRIYFSLTEEICLKS